MQSRLTIIMMLGALLVPAAAMAQTGEFVATVPGADVHRGYALQDEWQQIRSAGAPNLEPRATRKSKLESKAWHDETKSQLK
jgi:hypothetical protein